MISDRDLCELLERCRGAENIGFAIVHGLSDNVFNVMDLTDTTAILNYHPQNRFSSINLRLAELGEQLKADGHTARGEPSGMRDSL